MHRHHFGCLRSITADHLIVDCFGVYQNGACLLEILECHCIRVLIHLLGHVWPRHCWSLLLLTQMADKVATHGIWATIATHDTEWNMYEHYNVYAIRPIAIVQVNIKQHDKEDTLIQDSQTSHLFWYIHRFDLSTKLICQQVTALICHYNYIPTIRYLLYFVYDKQIDQLFSILKHFPIDSMKLCGSFWRTASQIQ